MTQVSLDVLARFAMLPRAAELIEAFSLIPPGPMRDAVVHLAQTTASTYTGAPMASPVMAMAPPVAETKGATPRLGRTPLVETASMKAVQLRIKNPDMPVPEIAAQVGLNVSTVYGAIKEAKKAGAPVQAKKRRSMEERAKDEKWVTSLDSLTPKGIGMYERQAAARGITPQEYLDRRHLALKMALDGAAYDEILKATSEKEQGVIAGWLSTARSAGHKVPYLMSRKPQEAAQEPQEAPPAPEPQPQVVPAVPEPQEAPQQAAKPSAQTYLPAFDELTGGGQAAIKRGAQNRKMTVPAYMALREKIVGLRAAGKGTLEIMAMTGIERQFITDAIAAARDYGATFPPVPMGHTAKKAAAE